MTSHLRTLLFGTGALALGLAAGPATAQDVDCETFPTMATAEPAEYAACRPPLVYEPLPSAGGAPAFGINLRGGSATVRGFFAFDHTNPAVTTPVAPDAASFFAGDFAGDDFSVLYAIDFPSAVAPSLYTINPNTGVKTLVAATNLPVGANATGMTWDYTTSTMYVTVSITTPASLALHTVDLTTGQLTLVAPITGITTPINLMAHPTTGQLYTTDISGTDDLFFSLDKTTGVATAIGPIGYNISFAQGADFDNLTEVAYMCLYQGGGVNSVRTVDLATGATTPVGSFDNAEVDFCASMNAIVPVELTMFEGRADGRDALLSWATASETNNAGFEVQVRAPGAEDYAAIGFIGGHGTTTEARTYAFRAEGLLPGAHTFRLRQVDFDGGSHYSHTVEVDVETPGTHLLTSAYPNPFNPQTTFTLSVAQSQTVRVELVNALGQHVGTLFNGALDANAVQTLTIDGAGLASGVYLVRVAGETFADALRISLVK